MKVNFGGGTNILPGFTNIDILDIPEVDMVADLSKGIPLPDNSVDEVIGYYFLAHLPDTYFIMQEIYRVCVHGAKVTFKIPYYQSEAAFKDTTQIRIITPRSFESFDQRYIQNGALQSYGQTCDFRQEKLIYNYYKRGMKYLPGIGFLRRYFWNIVKSYVIILRINK